jgi:hypothetical protein
MDEDLESHILYEDGNFESVAHRAKYSILNRYSLSPEASVLFLLYILIAAFVIHHNLLQVKAPSRP